MFGVGRLLPWLLCVGREVVLINGSTIISPTQYLLLVPDCARGV